MLDISANLCYYFLSPILPGANGDTMFLLFVSMMGCRDDINTDADYGTSGLQPEDVKRIKRQIDIDGKICSQAPYGLYMKHYCFYSVQYMDQTQKEYESGKHHASGTYAVDAWVYTSSRDVHPSFGWADLDSNLTPLNFVGNGDACPLQIITPGMSDDCRMRALITINDALLAFGARPVKKPEK